MTLLDHINAAGEHLRAIGCGCHLNYMPDDGLLTPPRDTWSVRLDGLGPFDIGLGDTPADALKDALKKLADKQSRLAA